MHQNAKPTPVFPFKAFSIDAIVIETVHLHDWALNYLMTLNGFRLEHQFAIDSFFGPLSPFLSSLYLPSIPPLALIPPGLHTCSLSHSTFSSSPAMPLSLSRSWHPVLF